MTIAQALEASRSVAPESTYLIHLCHDVSHAAMETQLPTGCHLAYDGLTINVGA
jgi:phosphoribosyl 1,2-cyclic phosphate phosphodiesterase